MDVPAYQPSTDRRPPMSSNGEVSSDSAAPRTISRPRGVRGGQPLGHDRECRPGGDHVVGVAAVERDAGHLHAGLAGEVVAPAAVVAGETVPGVPTDADALAGLPPPRDVLAHGLDHT